MLLGTTANAQFAKPLKQAHPVISSSEAKYNVGIIAGVSSTHWFHFGGTKTQYEQPYLLYSGNQLPKNLLNNGLAGLVVERRLTSNLTVGIEGLFVNRSTKLSYNYNLPDSLNHSQTYHRQDSILYREIDVQVPISYYFLDEESKVRPYVYVAPRFTLPLSGNMFWQQKPVGGGSGITVIDTVEMTAHNMRPWNIGAVVGAGLQFRMNTGSYYFLLRLDASCHFGIFNTYSKEEIEGSSQNVIGASYIDPTLLGRRHIGDATVRLTFLFPIKKTLKGACGKWGDYD